MNATTTIEVLLASWSEAQAQYDRGLRHGVVRLAGRRDLVVGQRVHIRMELPFAGKLYRVDGEVADVDDDGAMIFLEIMPVGLRMLFDDEEPVAAPMLSADEEPTRDSGESDFASESAVVAIFDALDTSDDRKVRRAPTLLRHVRHSDAGDDREIEIDHRSAEDDSWSMMIVEPTEDETRNRGSFEEDLEDTPQEILTSVAPFLIDDLGPTGVPRLEGHIEETGWEALFAALLRDHLTGVLEVGEAAERSLLSVRYGHIVHVQRFPPLPDHRGREAHTRGLLDETLAARLALLGRATGLPVPSLIDRLELLDASRRDQLRYELLVDDVAGALQHARGRYRFWRAPEIESLFEVAPGAGLVALLSWAQRRLQVATDEEATQLLAAHGGDHVYLTALGVEARSYFDLDEDQQRVLRRLVERDTPLGRVVGAEDDARGALTLVTALMQMELVDLVPCPAGSSRDLIFAERRLDELHGRLTADLFTVVNGHWTDDPGTVERLVRSACSVVDAVAMRDGEPGDLAAKRREIMEGLEQVALHLLRASPRRAYREALVPASQRRLAASQAVREAAALVRLGRADEARARCRTALELDPGGPGGEEIRGLARRLLDQLIGMGS